MKYGCPLCEFRTDYMVQFRKHLNETHPDDDNDVVPENIKIDKQVDTPSASSFGVETPSQNVEVLRLQLEILKLKMANQSQQDATPSCDRLVKVINNPIRWLGGNLYNNDFLYLREIIDNRHRNTVLNKGFMTAVVEILTECIERYGEKRFFPIACVSKVDRKLMFYIEGQGWTEDNSMNKYLHKVVCRVGQILCHFDEEDSDDIRWLKNREHWLLLVNACFAWDLPESDVYCKKKIERAVCELLYIV
jgi:hypothetical protein